MGYTITIGEARLNYSAEDLYLTIEAEDTTHPDAPDFDKYTGKGNARSPSYSGWTSFCHEAALFELFYGRGWDPDARQYRICTEGFHRERPLMDEHPGHAVLCQGDLDLVREARKRREASNGGKPPGFFEFSAETKWQEVDNGNDPILARLVWLEFWIEWALQNCKIPILQNT